MTETPSLFITSHAVQQFQRCITPMRVPKARRSILEGVRQMTNVELLPDGGTLRIRTSRPFPFEFCAFYVFDQEREGFAIRPSCVATTMRHASANVGHVRGWR
jgi:hypothetical protein